MKKMERMKTSLVEIVGRAGIGRAISLGQSGELKLPLWRAGGGKRAGAALRDATSIGLAPAPLPRAAASATGRHDALASARSERIQP